MSLTCEAMKGSRQLNNSIIVTIQKIFMGAKVSKNRKVSNNVFLWILNVGAYDFCLVQPLLYSRK